MDTTESQLSAPSLEGFSPIARHAIREHCKLVVVATHITQEALLAARILALANARSLDVLLYGVASSDVRESGLRRELALLAAFIRDAGTRVEIRLAHGDEWLGDLSAVLGRDDQLACCTGRALSASRRPLIDVLSSRLNIPVLLLDVADPIDSSEVGLIPSMAPWLSSLAIILGFLFLQIQVTRIWEGTIATVLLIALLPVEIGLVWLCNSVFS